MTGVPFIPQYITVHLGRPDDYAENVTVTFPDYIKNVASSEIYPTWPENALRANIYAQISFALNRFYTEWYRSRGYDFDITNSTQFDQKYIHGRDIYDSVSRITDELFNDYLRRQGFVEPLFAQFCDGIEVTCNGLSQWGSVTLANQGLTPYEIIKNYYGDNVDIVFNAPVDLPSSSYTGPLKLGNAGNEVRLLQIRLNRISRNYPAIPKINPVNGVFNLQTESAVRAFQRIFNLTADGIVGKSTWYKIAYLYASVKRLAELNSEGVSLSEVSKQYTTSVSEGDSGEKVRIMQYFLSAVANFNEMIPPITVDGFFGSATREAVIAFQKAYGLSPDGVVGETTWNALWRSYQGIVDTLENVANIPVPYPGSPLSQGDRGEDVETLQNYLRVISDYFPSVPKIPATGYFGEDTKNTVRIFQSIFGLEVDGIVGENTWNAVASLYEDVTTGSKRVAGQFPGYEIT